MEEKPKVFKNSTPGIIGHLWKCQLCGAIEQVAETCYPQAGLLREHRCFGRAPGAFGLMQCVGWVRGVEPEPAKDTGEPPL